MRTRLTAAALATLALAGAGTAATSEPASASGVRECGDFRTYLPIGDGGVATVVENITSRNVTCADARSFVRKAWKRGLPSHSGSYTVRGWKTYHVRRRTYGPRVFSEGSRADMRFTRPGKVIRFQSWTDYC